MTEAVDYVAWLENTERPADDEDYELVARPPTSAPGPRVPGPDQASSVDELLLEVVDADQAAVAEVRGDTPVCSNRRISVWVVPKRPAASATLTRVA